MGLAGVGEAEAKKVREVAMEGVVNDRGERLAGKLSDTGSREVVVLCHGFRSHKDNAVNTIVTRALAARGISAARFDFSGNGDSEGKFAYGGYEREVEDLRAVIQHLRSTGKTYGDIPSVVNAAGRFDMRRGVAERFGPDGMAALQRDGFVMQRDHKGEYRVEKTDVEARFAIDMRKAAESLKDCRVLTLHGDSDDTIPVEDARSFDRFITAADHTLCIMPGADHRFSTCLDGFSQRVLQFITDRD
eukprot:jgi/Chlat1/2204/Chrsp17S02765